MFDDESCGRQGYILLGIKLTFLQSRLMPSPSHPHSLRFSSGPFFIIYIYDCKYTLGGGA